jgi:recombinational DNA repair ATPase RecF
MENITTKELRVLYGNNIGIDRSEEVNDLEGYLQIGWDGEWTPQTKCALFKTNGPVSAFLTQANAQEVYDLYLERKEDIDNFTGVSHDGPAEDDLSFLRMASDVDSYVGIF